MEQMNTVLVEKLERILIHAASPKAELERMSLSQLLYYALVESGDDRGLRRQGVLLDA